ncbi:MAG: alpha-glucuronidase family glycosyl hydrolase [Armatimonadota bacterium]|nr:alpha-glucuronidase family glycosyl hydrolase [Armatimonadota bacterium]
MKLIFPLAFLLLVVASHASAIVNVRYDASVPTLEFACAEELKTALEAAKLQPNVAALDAEIANGNGWTIIVGLQDKLKTIDAALGDPKLEPEGYMLKVSNKKRLIYVVGADARGAMYGALDVTEYIETGGKLSGVKSKIEKPAMPIRSLKINMPGWSDQVITKEWKDDWDWFLAPDYWRGYFRMMARNRYNISTIWHSHPYAWMVRIPKYPEATMLSDEDMERFHKGFTSIFAEAARHGIDTYLITWNIHYPPKFAKEHKLKPAGQDTPVVRDYMREAIKAVLREYPGLTGIGTCPGENMPGPSEADEAWLMDTYVPALLEVRGPAKFIHRYWGSEPKPMQEVFAAHYPGKTYLDLKYNGESMYSSPAPHFVDPVWLNQKPRDYDILWHLRNDDLYIFRWGDPEFTRQTLEHCVGPGIAGFVTGSEYERPGPDRLYTDYGKQYQTWQQDFEKHWIRFMLWGKLSYNLELPDSYFKRQFTTRFGSELGPKLYKTQKIASKIMPLVESFHWNYMNFDWAGEACANPSPDINTARDGKGKNRNYREQAEYRGSFNNIREWIFNWTIDDGNFIGIPEYVGNLIAGVKKGSDEAKRQSPLEVADTLDLYAEQVEEGLREMSPQADQPGYKEAVSWAWDLRLLALLSRYYAEKTRGGSDLLYYWCTGDAAAQQRAISSLTKCKDYWLKIIDLGEKVYTFPKVSIYPDLKWSQYLKDIDQDIAFAQAPAKFKSRTVTWTVMEPVKASKEQLAAYEKGLESGQPADGIQFNKVPVDTIEIDLDSTKPFEFWVGMTNQKSRYLNLRRVWPNKKTGVAYLQYELPSNAKRWCVMRNDLGRVDKIWYGSKVVYDLQKQGSEALKKGFPFLVEPGVNTLTLRCDGVAGQDWGCSLRPEFKNTFSLSSKAKDADKILVTVKNSFPSVPIKGLKLKAIPWEPGWECIPAEIPIDVSNEAEAEFTLKQIDPASNWTGVTVEGYLDNERLLTGAFTELPNLKTVPGMAGDGQWRVEMIDGKWAMVTQPEEKNEFIYYKVDDKFLFNVDQDVTLSIEYYDTGEPSEMSVDYDSNLPGPGDGSFRRETGRTLGVKGWQTMTIKLPRAKLKNRAHDCDFRLSGQQGKTIKVRAVEVT